MTQQKPTPKHKHTWGWFTIGPDAPVMPMSDRAAMTRCARTWVMTMAWRGYEFVCLGCGALDTYFGPDAGDETPERVERMEATKAEWRELSAGLLSGGARLTACIDAGGECSNGEEHLRHATDAERAAHEAAVARIGERIGQVPA